MDVIAAMPDRDPADSIVFLAARRQSGAVHDVGGDLPPLIVGQHLVFRGGPDRAVPDGPGEAARTERGVRLL
jgi:hypothetical protein